MLSLSVMRLVPPPGRVVAGRVMFDGQDLLTLGSTAMRAVRGKRIAMIFQEPMTSLNPVFTVGDQITEAMRAHDRAVSSAELRRRTVAALDRVRIPAAAQRMDDYPHQLSGGMRQRALIAIGLACKPRLLIADEPTSALDVTVQQTILDQIGAMTRELGTAVLLITHDLGLAARHCSRLVLLSGGRIAADGAPAQVLTPENLARVFSITAHFAATPQGPVFQPLDILGKEQP